MKSQEAGILLDIRNNTRSVSDMLPQKGMVTVFEPIDSREIQASIKAGKPIEVGAFSNGKLFNLDDPDGRDLKEARFGLPRLAYITEVLRGLCEEDEKERLTVQLLKLEVDSAYASAVMIEAARKYHEKKVTGTLGEPEAQRLKDLLNGAQDNLWPVLNKQLADMALERIYGQDPKEKSLGGETREAWRRFLHKKYDEVFKSVYDQLGDEGINGRRLADMTAAFMVTSGLEMTGPAVATSENGVDLARWTVIYDTSLSSFNVDSKTRIIRTGERDKPLDRLGFEKLMMHEVLVHAWRAENGASTGYRAFQVGLPGYLEAEEGLGILMESLWSRDDPDALSRDHFRYAAVAYASGVYDDVLHTEQETYEFTKKLMDDANVHDDAELYRHVMRIFRGMPDGCRMRSNSLYLAGKKTMMQYFEDQYLAGDDIEETFNYLRRGKFDPTKPLHATHIEKTHTSGA